MAQQLVARVQPNYVFDAVWPNPLTPLDTRTPGANSANGIMRYGGAAVSLFTTTIGVGTQTIAQYQGQVGMDLQAGAGRTATGMNFQPALLKSNYGAASKWVATEMYRVVRIQALFAMRTTAGTDSGLAFVMAPDNASAPTYPSAAGNGAGWGIQGDGVGGMQFFAKTTIAGGFVDVTALTWPDLLTNVVVVDLEIQSATYAADATFRMWLNGVKVTNLPATSNSWATGTSLPNYGATTFNAICFAANVGTVGRFFVGSTRFLSGRFTADGIELLNALQGSV